MRTWPEHVGKLASESPGRNDSEVSSQRDVQNRPPGQKCGWLAEAAAGPPDQGDRSWQVATQSHSPDPVSQVGPHPLSSMLHCQVVMYAS